MVTSYPFVAYTIYNRTAFDMIEIPYFNNTGYGTHVSFIAILCSGSMANISNWLQHLSIHYIYLN